MLRGLPASIILHVAVIAAGSIVLPTLARNIEPAYTAVPIEIVDISDITNIRSQPKREDPESEAPPPLEELLDDLDTIPPAAPEDAERSAQAPAAAPEPLPDEQAAPDPAESPEPEDTPPEQPPAAERPILEQPPEDPLADILGEASNLFNRDPRNRGQRPPPPPPPPDEELSDETPGASEERQGAGEQTGNTAAISAILYSQLYICWDDVVDLPNPERLNVTIKMELNRDGTIKSGPTLVTPARPPIGDRAMGVAIERALRAARKCAPYRLPEDDTAFVTGWDEVILNIGPAYRQN